MSQFIVLNQELSKLLENKSIPIQKQVTYFSFQGQTFLNVTSNCHNIVNINTISDKEKEQWKC